VSFQDISVIISTYNKPEWLRKVLIGYREQSNKDFEVVIADDGSNYETNEVIDELRNQCQFKIHHVWHEDNGFQKTKILNKAIIASNGQYLIFTDGDCIPRKDFVDTHLSLRKKKHFLSGGYFKLPLSISKDISEQNIVSQDCFNARWLIKQGLKKTFKINKLTAKGIKARLLNRFTTTKATFDGMNASVWKEDILNVNGFDERMQYGGEDRELGERLMNNAIKPLQIRYSAICIHLDHSRSYKTKESLDKNLAIRRNTKHNKVIKTLYGIEKVEAKK